MSLAKYKQKRSRTRTAEPFGGKPAEKQLRFVIQKHDASHLHYDFRLEMEGVLKSWAVPKGPSTDPKVKRLAMMVEDHPFDYRTFEGIIPKGEYGGGTVIVWDEGTYESLDAATGKAAQEKLLLKQLKAGSLKFRLKGKKLKGEFALVKTKGMADNAWLLIKHSDKYASEADITAKDKSVQSGKTITQVENAAAPTAGRKTKKAAPIARTAAQRRKAPDGKALEQQTPGDGPVEKVRRKSTPAKGTAATRSAKWKTILKKAPRKKFFTTEKPMLATLVDKAFDAPDWSYEVKWDGYRALSFMNAGAVDIKSRNGKSFNDKFYPVYDALKKWGINAILDGEIVVVDEKGKADFAALQNWRSEADGELLYYVFDILWYDGYDLRMLELSDRKAILDSIMPKHDLIRLSNDFHVSGAAFLETAEKLGLEGIMAKREDSVYRGGDRSREWLKIKANKRQEVVIGGFTRNDDSPKAFSALLVGVFEKGKLVYTGKVGTGFSDKQQKEMMQQFKPLIVGKTAFREEPDVNKPSRFRPDPPHARVTWLKPKLICEVSFTEMTKEGVMRHPSFEGMREDKKPREVVREQEADTADIVEEAEVINNYVSPPLNGGRKTLLNPREQTQVKKIGGHELKFTNLSKIFWPEEGFTKRDLINYYYQVAPYILPYLKGRPQSLNRFPNGIKGKSFYQKDVTGKVPDWIDTHLYHAEGDNTDKHFLLGNNEATLLYMAGMGCIEMNPWSSTIKKPDHPTWCIIDLDPDKNSFDQVIEAARVTKEVLDSMQIDSYPKTSGSTGIHIYIPLGNKYTYEQSKEFARIVVTLVQEQLPRFTSLERTVRDRKGKMYLDFLQNRPQATVAAPYSIRPKPGATVSMPLEWDEVKKGLKMKDFTIKNALARLKEHGDIFKPVLGKGIDIKKIEQKMLHNS